MRALISTPDAQTAVSFADAAEPAPAPDEAVVAVRAFSLNRGELELLARRPEGWRPGQDVAGVVVDPAADGSGPRSGARVVGIVDQAGWAEKVVVPTRRLAPLTDTITMEQAATLPMAGLTALRTVRLGGSVLGRSVLVTGGNGGVGRYQVQLAALSGAKVTAVTSRAVEVGKDLYRLGAGRVVPVLSAATGPYDLVLESVGGDSLVGAIGKLTPGGTVVVLGTSSGEAAPLSVQDFIGHEGARLQNFISYATTDPDDSDLALLVSLVTAGRLIADPTTVADWSDAGTVIDRMRKRELPGGKAVLTIG